MDSILVPARFNGPTASANGGYMCGRIAHYLLDEPCVVRLHRPPRLEIGMRVQVSADEVEVYDGPDLVAKAVRCPPLFAAPPPPPSLEQASDARLRYAGVLHHELSRCFVCGRLREDGLHMFAGPVEDREIVACDWTPPAEFLLPGGWVKPSFVWAALDCPSFFGLRVPMDRLYLLGEMKAMLHLPIPGDRPLIVYAWSRGVVGRKLQAASALVDTEGTILAQAEQVWIAPR